jgi:uncharacterized protein with HEPN domain
MKKRTFSLVCWLAELLEWLVFPPQKRAPRQVFGSSLMLNGSLLSIIEEAGIAVLTLTEGLEKDEFLASRLTRAETQRHVKVIGDTMASVPVQTQALLAEVDWGGWHTVARQLAANAGAEQEALWFAIRSLVPATLMWLRVYRKNEPQVFECKPIPNL